LLKKIGLKGNELRELAWAGFLHDIGKIGVPDAILFKQGALDQEEWKNIKRHPLIGYEVIREIDFLKFAADIVLSHHEHYDGTGYPKGMQGKQIPLGARIFAIADALDAMTSDRPYRAAVQMETALAEIKKLGGKQFCPQCVAAMNELGITQFYRIQQHVKTINDIAGMRNGLDPMLAFTKTD
jgi:cyclic di-GMP phosphodiesterase